MEQITISVELGNAILNYLASKPYAETYQLIAGLQQAGQPQPVSAVLDSAEA